MSRIGKKPIILPEGVSVNLEDGAIVVHGPKGTLRQIIPSDITVLPQKEKIDVHRTGDSPASRAQHGLFRALVANMVKGVTDGYSRKLKIVGVGFRAEPTNTGLRLALGFSHPLDFHAPPGITIDVDKNIVTVAGLNKQLVGETAARLRDLKKPEPYKGKGIMYVDEHVRRKPGKAAKALTVAGGA